MSEQTIKNITGEKMDSGEPDWQRLVTNRQERIEKNLSLSKKYSEADNELNILLKEIGNDNLADKIRNIIDDKEYAYAHEQYNQGLFKGIKSALIFKKMNFNTPI